VSGQCDQLAGQGHDELADELYVVQKTLLDVLEIGPSGGVRRPGLVFMPADSAPAQTSREEAAALMRSAQHSVAPRERALLARRALALDPENADAYFTLTCDAETPEERLRVSAEGVTAGRCALGDAHERLRGQFGQTLATRRYMRALLAYARALMQSGDDAAAIAIVEEMLQLDARDAFNMHRVLAHHYAATGALDKLDALYERYRQDTSPEFLWNRVFIEYTLGRWPQACAAVKRARRYSPLVGMLLSQDPTRPIEEPADDDASPRAMALRYAGQCGQMWHAALRAWLTENMR
jgi:tetratricopeptide (TPR) repeat protein